MAAGFIYILALIAQLLLFVDARMLHAWCAAAMSVTAMLLLGFVDDVLDLRWKRKTFLPAIAVLPAMAVYRVMGHLHRFYFHGHCTGWLEFDVIELGSLYYVGC